MENKEEQLHQMLLSDSDEMIQSGDVQALSVMYAHETAEKYEKAREELLTIFDALADSYANVLLIDAEHAKIKTLKVDGAVKAIFTKDRDAFYDFDDVKNQYVEQRVHPKDREMMQVALRLDVIRRNMEVEKEYKGNYSVLEDGEPHYYQFKFLKPEGMKYIVGGFQNTDEIVENEKKQRKLQEEHQNELEEQLAIFNILSRNYRNVYQANINEGTARILKVAGDYDLPEVLAMKNKVFPYENVLELWIEKRVHEEDKERIRWQLSVENLREVLSERDEYTGTYRSLDGGQMHNYQFFVAKMDDAGNVIAGFQFIDHIIQAHLAEEQKQKEKENAFQRELKKQLQVIYAIGAEYRSLYLIDCESKTWSIFKTDGSTLIQDALDRSSISNNYDEVIRTYITNFVVEEDREYCLEHATLKSLMAETPDTGIHSLSYDRIVDGGRQHWQANTAKFTADDGKVYLVLGFRDVHDIVEKQISQENALRDALMLAKRANRAKTTFLNNMSHDIRTPMNAIIGFTALAQTRIEHPEQVQDYLKKIHTSSTHLLSLINEILDMSRIESGTVKLEENVVHLPDVLHELRTIIQGQVEAKQQNLFIDTLDVFHEDVITDKLRLNQILLNIVSNAIKYTDCGGNIEVRITEKPCAAAGYVTYVFSIRDNGMGMSPEFAEHVFDVFSRERTSTVSGIQGTGLGMAITKNIVDMMNGTITVESELGKGSEFVVTVSFKLAEDVTDDKPIVELKGARALVVDDNINTCQSVSKMLRSIDMRPDWSTSGKEAVVRAREAVELQDEYKAYIVDYMMPDMNGIETVRQIRKVVGDEIPIIVLTAYDWSDFEEEARAAGVTDFVSKPIFMSELRTVLSRKKADVQAAEKTAIPNYDYCGKKILLVEDNELNREIATFILQDIGIIVDTAGDGIEAVNIMNRAAEDQYDLILMDIQMPKMDGYTATKEIRTLKNNRKANIPIVAMTANAFDEDRKKSFEAGMNSHIAKPINLEMIVKTLDRIFKS